MTHPLSSPRGLWQKKQILINASGGILFEDYSASTNLLTANSTALKVAGKITLSGQTTKGLIGANSTALLLPNSVRVGTLASYITSNSTGLLLGSRYLSTNTTGNTTT